MLFGDISVWLEVEVGGSDVMSCPPNLFLHPCAKWICNTAMQDVPDMNPFPLDSMMRVDARQFFY